MIENGFFFFALVISFIFLFKKFLLSFNYSCLHFLPIRPPQPSQSHLLHPSPPSPLILSLCPLQQFLQTPLPTIPFPLPSGYCYIVPNFNVSGHILFAFFFVDYVPVKGEIIWYLSFLNCCSSTVVFIFPPPFSPSHPQSFPPLALSTGPLYMFLDLTLPFLSPVILLPPRLNISECQFLHL